MKQIHILIVTFQRPKLLARSLEHLRRAALRAPAFEYRCTVLINGTDLETQKYLEDLTPSFPIQILLSSARHTPAGARIEALKNIRHCDWIYFSDDDTYVPENFFLEFSALVSLYPRHAVYGGPNLTPPDSSEFQKKCGEVLGNRWLSNVFSYRYSRRPLLLNADDRHLILCNLFLNFSWFNHFQLPSAWPGGEENKALRQLLRANGKCIYSPKLYVFHERRPDLKSFSEQIFKYGVGRGLNTADYLLPFAMLGLITAPLMAVFTFNPLAWTLYHSYFRGIISGMTMNSASEEILDLL